MLRAAVVVAVMLAGAARAEGERAGAFDYWVLALSWAPSWCALEGDARGAAQCDPAADAGWTLHGLWPQFEDGWPSYCTGGARNPSRSETAAEADLFGSGGAAWHQWNKHGRCSGLSSGDFYRLSRLAYGSVARPEVLRRLGKAVRLPATVVEDAFLEANPGLQADMLTVTCRAGRVAEVRVCLDREMRPRTCGADVIRDCTRTVELPPVR